MIEELIAFVSSAFGGAALGRRLDEKRKNRSRARGKVQCAVRGVNGSELSLSERKWHRGEADLFSHMMNLDGLELEIETVLTDSQREPSMKEAWSINPSMKLLRVHNAKGEFEIALFPEDIEWFVSVVTDA